MKREHDSRFRLVSGVMAAALAITLAACSARLPAPPPTSNPGGELYLSPAPKPPPSPPPSDNDPNGGAT